MFLGWGEEGGPHLRQTKHGERTAWEWGPELRWRLQEGWESKEVGSLALDAPFLLQ